MFIEFFFTTDKFCYSDESKIHWNQTPLFAKLSVLGSQKINAISHELI